MSCIMPKINRTPTTSSRNSKEISLLDGLERLCRIIDEYLRWPIQLITIVCLFAFLEDEVAQKASWCVLGTGSASSAKKLIEKIPLFNRNRD